MKTPLPVSSSEGPALARGLDLLARDRLPPIPRALLEGRGESWIAPLALHRSDSPPPPSRPGHGRAELAARLESRNRDWGHPSAERLASRLAQAETSVVVTGQQTGLLGGPLYTLSKAVAAVKWAEALRAQGRDAVAVFWMATEDHDYREVARACLCSPRGLLNVGLGDDESPLRPVGPRTLGSAAERCLGQFADWGSGDRWGATVERLEAIWRSDARFDEAFPRTLVAALGERAPLLLDSRDPVLKRLQTPWLERLLSERAEVDRALAGAVERLERDGESPQVQPAPGCSPLFLLDGGERRRIEWTDVAEGRFRPRGEEGEWSLAELLERLQAEPESVSPGVLARPVIQDAVLGTALQVLGPGELSYMAQVAPLYGLLEVPAPAVALRPQVMVVDEKQDGWMAELAERGIDLEILLGEREDLERALLDERWMEPLQGCRDEVLESLDSIRDGLLELDPQLESPFDKTRDHVERSLGQLEDRVRKAAATRDEIWARRIETLRQHLLPEGGRQERVIAWVSLWARLGDGLIDSLFEQLDLDPRVLQKVVVRETEPG